MSRNSRNHKNNSANELVKASGQDTASVIDQETARIADLNSRLAGVTGMRGEEILDDFDNYSQGSGNEHQDERDGADWSANDFSNDDDPPSDEHANDDSYAPPGQSLLSSARVSRTHAPKPRFTAFIPTSKERETKVPTRAGVANRKTSGNRGKGKSNGTTKTINLPSNRFTNVGNNPPVRPTAQVMNANRQGSRGFFTGLLTSKTRVAPAKSAYFVAKDISADGSDAKKFTDYLEFKGCSSDSLKIFIGSIIMRFVGLRLDANTTREVKETMEPMMEAKFARSMETIRANVMALAEDSDDRIFMGRVIASGDNCMGYLADLTNAAKKKRITGRNVEGYLKMLGADQIRAGPIARLINDITPYFQDMVSIPEFRGTLHDSKWTDYRVTRVHAGKILSELISDFTALGLVTDEDIRLINDGKRNPWDININDRIPRRLIGLAMIYHIAAGTRIDGWYQGEKVMNTMPRAKVSAIRATFDTYFRISNEEATITGSITVADLRANINGKF